ncbi:hypothetical protein I7F13_26385 [Sinorhizobium meliloti]|nr:hypothetical protein [Sinorhizobium meliloti]MDE3825688.1 hypothetical protein [Sinorhizobium meliloti]
MRLQGLKTRIARHPPAAFLPPVECIAAHSRPSRWWFAGARPILPPMLHDSVHVPKPSLTEVLFAWFLRLVGASCFWFALSYWAMLIGFSHNGAGRFDLLSPEWRAAATALAVVYPVAAIGLWLLVSWGPVVWVVAAATEIAMDKFYPGILGHRPLLIVLHGSVAVTFVLFRAALLYQRLRQVRKVRVDSP